MKFNEQVGTTFGTIILVVIAITAGAFMWVYEKSQQDIAIHPQMINGVKSNQAPQTLKEVQEQPILTAEEYPTVLMQTDMTLEETIRQALYRKMPDWKTNYTITVTVETNERNHAIGRFIGYNVIKDDSKHLNTAEGIWFAAASDAHWTLTGISYTGYWGTCQDFQKYGFPKDMTPDCWDTEKNILIDTMNPERFYSNGFTKADKKELVQAYIEYANKNAPEGLGHWQPDRVLYVRINKNIENYLRGTFFISGSKNISAPGFYATKQSGKWLIVDTGQDTRCDVLNQYGFPKEIAGQCEPKEEN